MIFEQVLVAFILAFIFRAFVLEAFVIPTGSMASTLLGAHMDFACPDCGWRFQVNYPTDPTNQQVPAYAPRVYALRCANCAYRLPRFNDADPDNDATRPPVSYGDRVLVLKHAYLLQQPDRWEVVVFKSPSRYGDQYRHLPDWSSEPYQQNYIKRLIGLPGETLVLLDGDVYVTTAQKTLGELSPDDFAIARKTDVAQSALWRIVYDDDHRPQLLARTYVNGGGDPFEDPPWEMPWRQVSGGGWSVVPAQVGGGFQFDAELGSGTLGFDAQANPQTFAFSDFLTYDVNADDHRGADTFDNDFGPTYVASGEVRLNTVSDLRLSLFYEKLRGDGPLVLRMTKRGDVFEAELRDGSVRITGTRRSGEPLFARERTIEGDFASPRRVEFVNADYRVRLLIDGQVVLETTDDEYAPDVAALIQAEQGNHREPRPQVSITAADQFARVRHVSLWRDVYHTARHSSGYFYPYAGPAHFPRNVLRLGEHEYFTLGDNPALSGDARSWTEGLHLPHEGGLAVGGGRVPGRFMLGRAFFVYWPASFRPGSGLPAIVPNVGDMRFIR